MKLFDHRAAQKKRKRAPLADRMRPRSLDEVAGQAALLGEGAFLRSLLDAGEVPSMVLWGPPGCGKTTVARLAAQSGDLRFTALSAVSAGARDVREVCRHANEALGFDGVRTVFFLDEIHRFNKAQQDGLLPHVEDGTIILVGATTENPSFEVIAPLLSRLRVFVLEPLTEEDLVQLLERALADSERGLGAHGITLEEGALRAVAGLAGGDARAALTLLELACLPLQARPPGERRLVREDVRRAAGRRVLPHDKNGERHYDLISALHKAIRASDVDASLYWLARLLEVGDDAVFVARRLIRVASEDIGLADPRALPQAVAASEAVRLVGIPEADLALAQATVYLALAPKSNALYTAYKAAVRDVRSRGALPVPLYLRNAPTALLKDLGYAEGYQYAHDVPGAVGTQPCLPEALRSASYYAPTDRGLEQRVRDRMAWFQEMRRGGAGAEDPSESPPRGAGA